MRPLLKLAHARGDGAVTVTMATIRRGDVGALIADSGIVLFLRSRSEWAELPPAALSTAVADHLNLLRFDAGFLSPAGAPSEGFTERSVDRTFWRTPQFS